MSILHAANSQPLAYSSSDPRREAMTSPQLHLLEILQFPGVSRETKAVLTALLSRCVDDHSLSEYILQCIDEGLQRHDSQYSLDVLDSLGGCACQLAACLLLRIYLVNLVADTLNREANHWMSDFLLIGNCIVPER